MATHAWTAFLIILALIEEISPTTASETEEFPLTRSLGFALNKSVGILEKSRLNREFAEKYQEMIKASQQSFENFYNLEEKRVRRVVGDENLETMEDAGVLKRRRSILRIQSAVGRRRSRSQVSRRNKLNSQSLSSHLQHSKHKSKGIDSEQIYDQNENLKYMHKFG